MKKKINIQFKAIFFLTCLGLFVFCAKISLASQITEMSVVELVNKARSEKGLAPLELNEKLFQVAKDKADDMIKNNYFAHTSPDGITPWIWFEKEGYNYKFAGENLAINFSSVENQQEAWMNSETHRKNILDPNYREIGIAVQKGIINGNLTTITVQEFGLPVGYVESQTNQKTTIKKDSLVLSDISPQPKLTLIQIFNERLKNASGIFGASLLTLKDNFKRADGFGYLGKSATVISFAILIINPIIILWILIGSIVSHKKEKLIMPSGFDTESEEAYAEFLKRFGSNPQNVRTIYLEQMKLRR